MPIEDILYQAYLLILSWPTKQEAIPDSDGLPSTDLHNDTESDALYLL